VVEKWAFGKQQLQHTYISDGKDETPSGAIFGWVEIDSYRGGNDYCRFWEVGNSESGVTNG
jgi:hypothetical protein